MAGLRIGMLEGNADDGYIALGTGIGNIRNVKTAAEVAEWPRNAGDSNAPGGRYGDRRCTEQSPRYRLTAGSTPQAWIDRLLPGADYPGDVGRAVTAHSSPFPGWSRPRSLARDGIASN